jgi:5-methylcytosine-specific restriction endonuclease McrA
LALVFTDFTRIKLKGRYVPKAGPKITTVCEMCGVSFERTPAFHRSATAKGGVVRFCSSKCFGAAKSSGVVQVVNKVRPKITLTCEVCASQFERWPSALKWAEIQGKGVRFCSKECHGKARTTGMILLPRHTTEANRRKSDGNRAAWGLPPHDPAVMNLSKGQRATLARGIGFNPTQLRKWLGTSCVRCGATERLVLDHITCMAAGGKSVRENAQTLCFGCNRWKVKHVDKPLVRQQSLSGGP